MGTGYIQMADEKKIEETVVQEVVRGDRGVVGEASAAVTLKQMWHEATHSLEETADKTNPNRQSWVRNRGTLSLKQFAKSKAKESDKIAKEWFANKAGAKNEERSDKNKKRVYEEKVASKSARKKAGAGKQTKAKPAEVATVK